MSLLQPTCPPRCSLSILLVPQLPCPVQATSARRLGGRVEAGRRFSFLALERRSFGAVALREDRLVGLSTGSDSSTGSDPLIGIPPVRFVEGIGHVANGPPTERDKEVGHTGVGNSRATHTELRISVNPSSLPLKTMV
jgi:hypothetical protein